MTTYAGRLTPTGIAKQTAFVNGGAAIQIAQLAVGDGNGSPVTFTDSSVALAHEVHRVPISRAYVSGMKAYVEAILPLDVGGWWVRELSAIDSAGDVVALANVPEVYKPDPDSGASRLIVITMSFTVAVANVVTELVMDPSIVLATRAYADSKAQAAATYAVSRAVPAVPLQAFPSALLAVGRRTTIFSRPLSETSSSSSSGCRDARLHHQR